MKLTDLIEEIADGWIEDYENRTPIVKTRDGNDPKYVYRVMSRRELQKARESGFFTPGTDGRIHASERPETRYKNSPDDVTVKLHYSRIDGWRAKWGDKLYVITDQPVPISRIASLH